MTHEERLLAEVARLKDALVRAESALELKKTQLDMAFGVLTSKVFIFFLLMMRDSTQENVPVYVSTPERKDQELKEFLKRNGLMGDYLDGNIVVFRKGNLISILYRQGGDGELLSGELVDYVIEKRIIENA